MEIVIETNIKITALVDVGSRDEVLEEKEFKKLLVKELDPILKMKDTDGGVDYKITKIKISYRENENE